MSPLPYEVPHHGDEDMNKQVGLTPHYYFIPTVYITRCVLACLVEVLTTRLSRIIPPPLLAKTLSPLQECCARWRDGNWYRARFIKYLDKEHQRCFVVLVDYGNIYQVGVEGWKS